MTLQRLCDDPTEEDIEEAWKQAQWDEWNRHLLDIEEMYDPEEHRYAHYVSSRSIYDEEYEPDMSYMNSLLS